MSIKTKIAAALAFMFVIIVALGGLGIYYLNELSGDSQAILKDNYISLEYASNMQKALAMMTDPVERDPDGITDFERNLKKQEANITEIGEQEVTSNLRREFNRLKTSSTFDPIAVARIRQQLFTLDDLNRQAIVRKNETAKQTAKDALLWLASVGTLFFLILFSFIINFPGYVANPVRELTRGIKQIAKRNFEERLHIDSNDEFGELAQSFNSMAQKLDEYEHSNLARVLFEKRRIDTLIRIMSEGIVGMDENKRILFANPVACRLLGVNESQLLGQYAPDIAASNDLMRTLIQDVMTGNTSESERNGFLKIYDSGEGADGLGKESYFNRRTHTVEVIRTGESQPELAGYVMVLENITPYKELDLAKTNFIATISHELKTPLSSSKMSLKLLEDSRIGQLNDEQKSLVSSIGDDINRLLNLTGELLNMAQVESGQIQLNIQPVAPADIVTYAANALRVASENKHISLALNIFSNLPAVLADPDKASWVLVNFLSNAIRHSPKDSVIEVLAQKVGAFVEFRVRDHGAGIRPEHQNRVFDRYFKVPGLNGQPNENKTTSGTGLGLAISSEFIQSMNGQIGLDTTVTDGAAFYFRLPVSQELVNTRR
ncbi:ATP-binding protein [Spirosoma linguale]|uniref:histidine kinase n=1 Tax=Spirosoma linguale (strain ATCC 33905 / DSM 74 / LMG 10896 / Claus 1) TaxID=504472 RepID=D2QBF9_SPILD|nr:PAS/PAC sensor signal transduction histidine kinase [Spirosoma linguale DSM 74]